ncbi:hypothetical protein VP01_1134g1 [Puccinia sorghi]|uniref:Uncharacterized protein n=1 Tax=Puccinia sorghi TaxID=27349 RepID=A0A0L6VS22_9BASI|nr:hypothetical protein VP01_1134g1 [Puccinia sorghi]
MSYQDTNTPPAAGSTPPAFACIIPSRPVQTQFTHLPPDRFVFQFSNPDAINHLVVFLTGVVPLPDDYGASIHFQFAGKPEWHLLGMISGEKPSAIFRLKDPMKVGSQKWSSDWTETSLASSPVDRATLGILVAPLHLIQADCHALSIRPPASSTSARSAPRHHLLTLAKAVAQNLFHYLASFSGSPSQPFFPLHLLEEWWALFQRKIDNSNHPEQWLLDSAADSTLA